MEESTRTTHREVGVTYLTTASAYIIIAWILWLTSFGFLIAGIYRMYAYDYSDRIVGGDAYNYTILATRGVGLICTGIASAILAGVLVLFSIEKKLSSKG